MPFNGSGTYVAPSSPGAFNPAVSGSSATPEAWNTLLDDIETALSTCITKDGQTTVTANIPMANNKITELANGTAITDAATLGQVLGILGVKPKVTIIDVTGMFTPDADAVMTLFEAVGGGGGGAGQTGGVGSSFGGGGGGGGGYASDWATPAEIGASQTVTIGAAGAAGAAGTNSGGAGGTTSVGVLCVAGGGGGGSSTGNPNGGAGGSGATGDVLGVGASGGAGQIGGSLTGAISGAGGASRWGGGGPGLSRAAPGVATGQAGNGPGSGGSGGVSYDTAANVAGGAGVKGRVVVTEWLKA